MARLVESKAIKRSSLHEPLPFLLRLNVVPFILGYAACVYAWINHPEFEDYPLFIIPVVLLTHILSFLVCIWSVDFKTFLTRRKATIKEGAEIKIIPVSGKGPSVITNTQFRRETNQYYISWRNRIFIWSEEKKIFEKIPFPTNLPLDHYLKSKGFSSDEDMEKSKSIYGTNKLAIFHEILFIIFIIIFIIIFHSFHLQSLPFSPFFCLIHLLWR